MQHFTERKYIDPKLLTKFHEVDKIVIQLNKLRKIGSVRLVK